MKARFLVVGKTRAKPLGEGRDKNFGDFTQGSTWCA